MVVVVYRTYVKSYLNSKYSVDCQRNKPPFKTREHFERGLLQKQYYYDDQVKLTTGTSRSFASSISKYSPGLN